MDWVLLAVVGLFGLKGFFKGFLSMFFSLVGTFVIVVLSYGLCAQFEPIVDKWIGQGILNTLKVVLDGAISGQFSDVSSLQVAISSSKYALLFHFLLYKVLGNLTIDGTMSAGQILAPTITAILVKVIAFTLLFVVMYVILRLVVFFLNKIIKKCGMKTGNRIFGGVLGVAKGLVMFGVIYFVLSTLANLLMNETLLTFVQNGVVSKFLYDQLILKMLNLIY